MTNSTQSNKRAVTRFTALFICMIFVFGIALPFISSALTKTVYFNTYFNCKMFAYNFGTGNSISIQNGGSSMILNDNDRVLVYAYNSDTYYKIYYRLNNSFYPINGTYENPTIIPYNVWSQSSFNICAQNYISTQNQFYFILGTSGYTLSFNSQGGSSISTLTGVSGIIHLGESGEYYPQYIPTLYGYDFVGWSLTENGTILFDVDIQSDTVLYARWSIQSQYVNIRFGDGFYEDSNCTDDITGYFGVKGESLTFYAKKKLYQYTDITYDPLEHFYGSIHYSIGTVGYDMQGEMISGTDNPTEERIYKYNLYLDDSYYIQVNSAPLYKCWFRFSTPDYQEFDTGINYVAWYGQTFAPLWYRETNAYLYTTDSYLGMDLEVWIRLPYIINKPFVFDPALFLGDEYDQRVNHDLRFSEDIVEDYTAYGATIHYHIIANPFQSQEALDESEYVNIILAGKSITDYDITDEYSAVIVYDENSNASWAFSEVELLDTNWSEVNENIPTKLNSFFGGLFSLSGLAVLIPMVMMVSFAIWFIRRS